MPSVPRTPEPNFSEHTTRGAAALATILDPGPRSCSCDSHGPAVMRLGNFLNGEEKGRVSFPKFRALLTSYSHPVSLPL